MSDKFRHELLQGKYVRLEPLLPHHYRTILDGLEPDIFTYMNHDSVRSAEALKSGKLELKPTRKPFVTFAEPSGAFAGSTSLYVVNEASRTFEIGGTWVKKAFQGTKLNAEAKYLMFEYAFEAWRAIRVQIRTHNLNRRSKAAIEKLGITKEGVVRSESIFTDGTLRDTALYSVIEAEWPSVKAKLRRDLYSP